MPDQCRFIKFMVTKYFPTTGVSRVGYSYRRTLLAVLLTGLLLFNGCAQSSDSPEEEGTANGAQSATPGVEVAASEPAASVESEVSIAEEPSETPEPTVPEPEQPGTEVETTREALLTYPGVLTAYQLPKEKVLQLLGEVDTSFENLSQGYSMYTWDEPGLTLEYDSYSGELTLIRTAGQVYHMDAASYYRADLTGDGILEGICAFEVLGEAVNGNLLDKDAFNRRIGRVVIIDEATGRSLGDSYTRAFEGHSAISVLPDYGAQRELLILLDTRADMECDVLSYENGQLVSRLPTVPLVMEDGAAVTLDMEKNESRVRMEIPEAGLSFNCPLPLRLEEALKDGEPFRYRFVTNRKPVVTDEGLTLRIRQSLQVMLGEAYTLEGLAVGRHVDIGQITQEYRYMGTGSWELLKTSGSAKYAASGQGGDVTLDDLMVGQAILFAPVYDYVDTFELDPESYQNVDLMAGIKFRSDGLQVSIANSRIVSIVMESESEQQTPRGLAVGDSRGEALKLYGQPDVGYFEDRLWTYWFYRPYVGNSERTLSLDSFSIEFSGDRVARILMKGYVPID